MCFNILLKWAYCKPLCHWTILQLVGKIVFSMCLVPSYMSAIHEIRLYNSRQLNEIKWQHDVTGATHSIYDVIIVVLIITLANSGEGFDISRFCMFVCLLDFLHNNSKSCWWIITKLTDIMLIIIKWRTNSILSKIGAILFDLSVFNGVFVTSLGLHLPMTSLTWSHRITTSNFMT